MNDIYPLSTSIILTDDIFVDYGGTTGTTTAAQREAAYFIAEEAASNDIGTLLLPVRVTGTYSWNEISPVITDFAYVSNVVLVRFLDTKGNIYYTISGTANVHVSLRDNTYGIIDIHTIFGNCQCASPSLQFPYHVQVVYEAGLPTGTANQPNVLLALSTYADVILNEIVGYGNETPGGVGVQQFRNQQYAETRVKLKNTAFGSSPRAQLASSLLTRYRVHRYVGL